MLPYKLIGLPLLLPMMLCFVNAWTKEEIENAFNPFPPIAEEYTRNDNYYTNEGHLFISGDCDRDYSNEINLFIKKEAVERTPYFSMRYCLKEQTSCTKGLTTCYDSKLNAKYVRGEYHIKRQRSDLYCKNNQDHAFNVYTDENGEHFLIKASIDKHIYKFPVPKPMDGQSCFYLHMGSEDSIDTVITDLEGNSLLFIGNSPKSINDFADFTYKKDSQTMNLWMLFLDFMPFFPLSTKFKPRKVQFTHGGNDCGLTVKISSIRGNSLHTCTLSEDAVLRGCRTLHLEGAGFECEASVHVTKAFSEDYEKMDGAQFMNQTSDEWGVAVESSIQWGIIKDILDFGVKITGDYRHISTNSKTIQTADTHRTGTVLQEEFTQTAKVHRTDGSKTDFFALNVNCAGIKLPTTILIVVGDPKFANNTDKDVAAIEITKLPNKNHFEGSDLEWKKLYDKQTFTIPGHPGTNNQLNQPFVQYQNSNVINLFIDPKYSHPITFRK